MADKEAHAGHVYPQRSSDPPPLPPSPLSQTHAYREVAEQTLTISMIRCPQALHLSADCWKPEYCNRQERLASVEVDARLKCVGPLVTDGRAPPRLGYELGEILINVALFAHQKIFFAENLPAHVVKRLSSQPSTCRHRHLEIHLYDIGSAKQRKQGFLVTGLRY